jgi:uncharacterized protein with PIN domain
MDDDPTSGTRFLVDRMLGTLTRYLRFMGYDTLSACDIGSGDSREDTQLLALAEAEDRILLTHDAELARRGGRRAVYVREKDVDAQLAHLIREGFIARQLPMSRCSLCNTPLREATPDEVADAAYTPVQKEGFVFFWCQHCRRLYWNGSHQKRLEQRILGNSGAVGDDRRD